MPADRLIHPRLGHSQKVSSLSHLQARVWKQYILSADDFGVMPCSALKLQADNLALAREPKKTIEQCLEQLVKIGLVGAFEHQGERFLFQRDWQDFQKVEYPRITYQPKIPKDLLKSECTPKTRRLFGKYPGGSPKSSPKVFRKFAEDSPTNARARTRETANGKRQTLTANANGGKGEREKEFRPTPDEIKRARRWREAIGRCPHDPRCKSSEFCLGVQIQLWRAELQSAPEVHAS